MNKRLFAFGILLVSLVNLVNTYSCCNPSGSCTCTVTGSCVYTCLTSPPTPYYNCDSDATNGCESTTPCNHYTFQRYTFNLSGYALSNIATITYCFKGYYSATGSGSAKLQYYNASSGLWVDDQSLDTSSSSKCKSFTSTEVVNSTSSIFQFSVRGFTGDSGQVTIYADNVNLSLAVKGSANPIVWVNGKYGSALNFSGSNYIQVNDPVSLDITNQLTLEAWVNTNTVNPIPNIQTILMKGYYVMDMGGTSYTDYSLSLQNSEVLFGTTFLGYQCETSGANLHPNAWYHIAAVFNYSDTSENHTRIYVNGVQIPGVSCASTGNLVTNNQPLTIGTTTSLITDPTYYFNGTIDELAIYSRAKSASEIYADANPLYVSASLTDSLNNSISIRGSTSGYVNAGGNNTVYIKTSNGGFNMTAGAYSGIYSLRVYANNTKANLLMNVVESGVSSIQAIIPIQLRISQQTFNTLVIAEK